MVLAVSFSGIVSPAKSQNGYITDVRSIETAEDLGVVSPVGLTYSPQAGLFQLIDAQAAGSEAPQVVEMTPFQQLAGQASLSARISDPLNVVFNTQKNSLFHLDQAASRLEEISLQADGRLATGAGVSASYDVQAYGLAQAEGMAFNPADGSLYFLDAAGKHLVVVAPDAGGSYDGALAQSGNRIQRIDLKGLGAKHLRGLAYHPVTGHLFVTGINEKTLTGSAGSAVALGQAANAADPFGFTPDAGSQEVVQRFATTTLYEITLAGELVDTYDLTPYVLRDPGAMVFAPSGDATDDPANLNLYIADSGREAGQQSGFGQIFEFSFTAPVVTNAALAAAAAPVITRVQVINTSSWSIPSPDPAGLEYNTATGKLLMSDSEVDEMNIFQNKNVFETTVHGSLGATCNVQPFSKEPAGLTINPANGNIFISDDGKALVFEIDLGPDNIYCTGDDVRRSFATTAFNDSDPEGLAFGQGKLIVTGGMNAEIYVIGAGSNGIFGDSDDQITNFDTNSMGVGDPEGVGYHPERQSLFIAARKELILVETSLTGTVLNVFDLSGFSGVTHPSGVAVGPSSGDPTAYSIYVTDRGIDNNDNPNENDGKIHEFVLDGTPPPPTPTPPPITGSLYLSFGDAKRYTVGSVANVRDEDIVSFNGTGFAMYFDGSDVGVGTVDVDAFAVVDANTILMSFDKAITLTGAGAVADTDIVQFEATSLGNITAGSFSLYFNGADVGLDTSAEDIDGLSLLSDGSLLISTLTSVSVPGVTGQDEDILRFAPTSLGSNTSGTWSLYFDGSDVGLDTTSDENVMGIATAENGDVYLSTRGNFSVAGLTGDNDDIFICTPASLGDVTSCTFSLFFDGGGYGLSALGFDGIDLP